MQLILLGKGTPGQVAHTGIVVQVCVYLPFVLVFFVLLFVFVHLFVFRESKKYEVRWVVRWGGFGKSWGRGKT